MLDICPVPDFGTGRRLDNSGLAQSPFYLGILYLCVLPSTVQSSIAFTSMAGGNVSAAIVSASASNIFGMFLTPLLVGLLFAVKGGGGISVDALESILLQLLAPFVLGQILQPWIGNFMRRHNKSLGFVDRGSILMVVYLAFSEAIVEGLWHTVSWNDLGVMIGVNILLLVIVMLATGMAARRWALITPTVSRSCSVAPRRALPAVRRWPALYLQAQMSVAWCCR